MRTSSSYQKISQLIEENFFGLKRKYPLSFYYLEDELRLLLNDENYILEQNLKRYADQSTLKLLLLEILLKIYIALSKCGILIKKKRVFLSIARHPQLAKKLLTEINKVGLSSLENPRNYVNAYKLNKYFPLGSLATCNFELLKIHGVIQSEGLPFFINSDTHLCRLERVLAYQVCKTKDLLLLLGINYMILQNEHCPHEKLLLLAGEKLGVKTFVVAHGYLQKSGALITVAPIYAHKLIVWTEAQRKMILQETMCHENKVAYFGWPFEKIKRKYKPMMISPLFVLTDLDNDIDLETFEVTMKILSKFVAKYPNAQIRPHPNFSFSNTQRKKIIVKHFGAYIKYKKLDEQLMSATFVTGHDSSVLVQAFFGQIPTYRIQEISILDIDEVPTLSFRELISLDDNYHSTYNKQSFSIDCNLNQLATKIVFELSAST